MLIKYRQFANTSIYRAYVYWTVTKLKIIFKEKGKFWGKRKYKKHIEKLENDLSIIRPEKHDDYIEALKSRRKKRTIQIL